VTKQDTVAVRAALAEAARLVERLQSMTAELKSAAGAAAPVLETNLLEIYGRAVRELRAAAIDTGARLDRADPVLGEAREFVRLRRRRANKIGSPRPSDS
jgi:hypothetical protein